MAARVETGQLQRELNELNCLGRQEFVEAVLDWGTDEEPTPLEEAAFSHPDIWGKVKLALAQGISELIKEQERERDPALRREALIQVKLLQMARRRVQALRKVVVTAPRVDPQDLAKVVMSQKRELFPEERELLAQMVALDDGGFSDAVFLWATGEGGLDWMTGYRVFGSPEIVERAVRVLGAHVRESQREEANTTDKETIRALRNDQKMLGGARNELKPLANVARASTTKGDDETRALNYLRKTYFAAYNAIKKDVKSGLGEKEVLARAAERRDSA